MLKFLLRNAKLSKMLILPNLGMSRKQMNQRITKNEQVKSLTIALQANDKDAFAQIFNNEKRKCTAIAYNLLWPDHEEAQDVVQYAFLKLWNMRHSLDPIQGYRQWLYTTVRNRALDIIKVKKNQRAILQNKVIPQKQRDQENTEPKDSIHEEMKNLVEKLSEKYRAVILLKYWGKFSFVEIAKILEIPEGTVRSRLHHAHQKLKKYKECGTNH